MVFDYCARRFRQSLETVRTAPLAAAVRLGLIGAGAGASRAATAKEDAAAVANRVQNQVGAFADLIGAAAFLIGIGFVVFGIFRLYNHSKNPNDPSAKLSTAVILVVAGGAMIAVPTVAGVGVVSLFGGGADVVSTEGTLRSLGSRGGFEH